jgi:hypothetical protein
MVGGGRRGNDGVGSALSKEQAIVIHVVGYRRGTYRKWDGLTLGVVLKGLDDEKTI